MEEGSLQGLHVPVNSTKTPIFMPSINRAQVSSVINHSES